MSALLPCPFCGGNDIEDLVHVMYCRDCGAEGPPTGNAFDRASLRSAWNRRAEPVELATLRAENARLTTNA